jgi:class 3 adenylate cyclase
MDGTPRSDERPGRAYLKRLLAERNQSPDCVSSIDALLRSTFERTVAVLVLDMCGFTRFVHQYGIIEYLAMIVQMEEAARPAVLGNRGQVIKQEADNLFAIFDTPTDALEAALDIFRAFEAVNSVVPAERDIFGSIGIGYGNLLVIGDEDVFGDEMNLASKLGEDLAGKTEILLTESAARELAPDRYVCSQQDFFVGGLRLTCYRVDGLERADRAER